jgi:hypothetical protein
MDPRPDRSRPSSENFTVKPRKGYEEEAEEMISAVSSYGDKTKGHFNGTHGYWVPDPNIAYWRVVKNGKEYECYSCPGVPGEWIRSRSSLWVGTVTEE